MRVVVLAIGAAAGPGPLQVPPGQMLGQGPVEELATLVRVEVFHRIRPGLFQRLQRHPHGRGALVPDGPVLRPTAVKLGKREGMDVIAPG